MSDTNQLALDPLDRPIWGIPRIARAVDLNDRQTYYKAERGLLPVSKIGGIYMSTPRRLKAFLNGEWKPAA